MKTRTKIYLFSTAIPIVLLLVVHSATAQTSTIADELEHKIAKAIMEFRDANISNAKTLFDDVIFQHDKLGRLSAHDWRIQTAKRGAYLATQLGIAFRENPKEFLALQEYARKYQAICIDKEFTKEERYRKVRELYESNLPQITLNTPIHVGALIVISRP